MPDFRKSFHEDWIKAETIEKFAKRQKFFADLQKAKRIPMRGYPQDVSTMRHGVSVAECWKALGGKNV